MHSHWPFPAAFEVSWKMMIMKQILAWIVSFPKTETFVKQMLHCNISKSFSSFPNIAQSSHIHEKILKLNSCLKCLIICPNHINQYIFFTSPQKNFQFINWFVKLVFKIKISSWVDFSSIPNNFLAFFLGHLPKDWGNKFHFLQILISSWCKAPDAEG